jgi:protein-S-isoprenylcysteine O-methyltransferase Ste14
VDIAGRVIAACWAAFFLVWFIAAWFAKRTVERSHGWARWAVWVIAALLMASHSQRQALTTDVALWRTTPALGVIAAVVTAAGLAIAVWARAALGGNWSGAIVLKQQHELIDRGPYAFVRHPIYTGVLVMVLGTVMFLGTRTGAIVFAIIVAGLIVKAGLEERLLMKHFPSVYSRYRARVRARLVPFVM